MKSATTSPQAMVTVSKEWLVAARLKLAKAEDTPIYYTRSKHNRCRCCTIRKKKEDMADHSICVVCTEKAGPTFLSVLHLPTDKWPKVLLDRIDRSPGPAPSSILTEAQTLSPRQRARKNGTLVSMDKALYEKLTEQLRRENWQREVQAAKNVWRKK